MSEALETSAKNNTIEGIQRLQDLEAKALEEATATADAAFVPSASLWNATTPTPLLKHVDGPSLTTYQTKESIYVGRSVPVGAGKVLKIPIQVSTPGSVVDYSVENKSLDIGFGITAEREQGVTVVKVCADLSIWWSLVIVSCYRSCLSCGTMKYVSFGS